MQKKNLKQRSRCSEITSIIQEYGSFIAKMEENHKKEGVQESLMINKPTTEKIYEILSVKIEDSNSCPFIIFIKEEIKNYLDAGILKHIDHRGVQEGFSKFIFHEKLEELAEMLFWQFLIIKYPIITGDEGNYHQILKEYRRKISSQYVTFIILLPQHQKENLLNLLIFSIAYVVLMIFCKHFPNEKTQINNRFLLDIFHIILFELNGVCVSDYYVQNMIEKLFTYKFLTFYKEYGNFKKPESPPRKPKNFLGQPIIFPENMHANREMVSFSHELSSVLYKNIDFARKTKFLKISAENSPLKDYRFEAKKEKNDTSDISINKGTSNFFVTNPSISVEENNYINKMKFDCCQISPTISSILENGSMSLPHIKKKVINHPIDKSIDGNHHKPRSHLKIPDKPIQPSSKKKLKNSILDTYNYSTNDLSEDYRSNSKYLKDLYEMKFVLDKNHQPTSQLPSSKKLLEAYQFQNQKSEYDYLIDEGYSPHCIESLRDLKESEEKKLISVESLRSELLPPIALKQSHQKIESPEDKNCGLQISPKMTSTAKIKGKFRSIVAISEKPEEKPIAYAMVPKQLKAIILEKNQTLEEKEEERKKMETENTEIILMENPRLLNYKDSRKKYREEHLLLVKGSLDANINLLVSNIIQKKEAATRNILKFVKAKRNLNLNRHKIKSDD